MNKKEGDFANIMEELHRQKPLLARNYNVDYLGVFGSFVRREQVSGSDLDILISFHKE